MAGPKLTHIGVLTSGGDAPGMNACVRAVTRAAIAEGCRVTGILHGFRGMVEGRFQELTSRSVGGILRQGGTILQSSRCLEFKTDEGQEKALANLRAHGIQGVVVIGGDGSMAGVQALVRRGFPAIGVPATIDNDLYGTDLCIGVDTALQTIVEAIDKLKDTASSLERAFVVEVMGRNSGWLALAAGVAGGAEAVLIPEREFDVEALAQDARRARERGKPHYIIVAAEALQLAVGPKGKAFMEAMERSGFTVRATVLGHVQRGGSPTPDERILATRLGAEAARSLISGRWGTMVGVRGAEVVHVDLEDAINLPHPLDEALLELSPVMAL